MRPDDPNAEFIYNFIAKNHRKLNIVRHYNIRYEDYDNIPNQEIEMMEVKMEYDKMIEEAKKKGII